MNESYELQYEGEEIDILLGKAATALQEHQDISHLATRAELETKQDTIGDLDAIRSGAAKGATALQSYTEKYQGTVTDIKVNGMTMSPSDGVVDLGTVITQHQDISGKQDRLVSGVNIKTINGNSLIGSGNIVIESGDGEDIDLSVYATKEELTSGLAGKQDELVSGRNIKTINGYSILGSGNISIGGGGGEIGYSAKISLSTPQFNAVLKDSTGHYIEFTFDTTNGAGDSIGEGVTCTYTITRGTNKVVVTERYRYNTKVRFNIDKYLQEGANDIVIHTVGDISGMSTSIGVTFQVVDLALTATYDISRAYDLSNNKSATVEVPFTISGYGTKVVEWYLDGQMLDFVKDEDEVVDVSATRTKYITISNLQQGKHSLQLRAYTNVNGELFYTDTSYYDLLVYTGVSQDLLIGVAATIPVKYGVLGANDELTIYDAVQYKTYNLRFATYSPTSVSSTMVQIYINGELVGEVSSANGRENEFRYTPTSYGNKTLKLHTASTDYIIPMVIGKTSMTVGEITTALALDFNANGRSNNSSNKDQWSYKDYSATFTGFNWNSTSGWVNGRLEMNAGSSLAINYAPLATSATKDGKTIELEWSTKNVANDDAIICDLRGDNGVGILITATKVSMTSADGVVVETEYKSEENVRVGFVINKASGATNQRLSFIYSNGIVSRGEKWSVDDNYLSDKEILFTATEGAEISLKSIRIYDAALTSDQMLNNYILYRDSVSEMMEVYDRNDIYVDGTTTFSPDKMMSRLPVMIVTGDIPVLENTSDKDTQIVVDIEYHNLQNPSKSFKMKGAAMRPQGTSSMGYPKKNFRIYTEKVDGTILYDADGNVVEDKLYSFTDKAQPVNCWCLKADYAESSGTHNTGIARLWNNALMNVQVDGEYVCRTEAQKKAIEAKYEYDVRTTIDGFPILLFYRPSENDDVIFIGKYNFNNDKSTESVFGFTGIPNFDNSRMQCWEVLNNGNPLALFTTTDGFDEGWAEAFESRYPDTKTPYTGDLKAFAQWMVNVSQEDFATQKWEHLNIYMMAAYWVYLMRHAAADQFVKNAMFTSEDGQHFYYILYDNDTINGLINTGRLRIKPTDDRQTVDDTGSYVFAGHDSRLWNMLEADEEFKNIVSAVDNALYSAGISYANTIKVFDDEQADKWVEKVYNQDAQYKYVGPYIEKGIDNLFMLQGKRDLHRRWWLAKRFSIYDAKYVSGTYKSQAIEIKCLNGTTAGQRFSIVAGYPLDYGYGINNVPRTFGITLDVGDSYTFETRETINLGDPLRIYGAPNIAEVDLSPMASRLAVVTIANVYDESLGTKLTKLVLGKSGVSNLEVTEISGLKQAISLEYLDIRGMKSLTSIDLSAQTKLKTLIATSSGATSFTFAKGAPLESLALPSGVRTLALTQLPYLHGSGITFEALAALESINITSCPHVTNDFSFVYNWYKSKNVADSKTSLVMDYVDWKDVDVENLLEIANIGTLNLKGKITLNSITYDQMVILMDIFGESAFNENSELFIDGPDAIFILGRTELLEGESEKYKVVTFGGSASSIQFSLFNGNNSYTSVTQDGTVTIREGFGSGSVTMRVIVTKNGDVSYNDVVINVVKRIYPNNSNLTIEGSNSIENEYEEYELSYPDDVTGEFDTAWTLIASEEGFVEIESYNDFSCTLKRVSETYVPIYLTLTATLTKKVNGAAVASVSKDIAYVNDDIAEYDAGIIAALYAAGLCSSDKYITKDEAAKVTASDLQKGTSANTSIFYNYRNQIKNFDGFQYFTSVTEIPTYCFSESTIESIILHGAITTIGNRAFYVCERLKSINLPKSLISIGSYAFYSANFESINLPEGLMQIGSYAFQRCSQLKEIVIPSTLSQITSYVFDSCHSLKRVVLKEGVQSIVSTSFENCAALETFEVASTTTTLGGTFDECTKLQFFVADANPNYKSIDGVLFNKGVSTLLLFRKNTDVYTIPSSVNSIAEHAFYKRDSIEEIYYQGEGLSIGYAAFYQCSNLRKFEGTIVRLVDGLEFIYCKALEEITISVDKIPSSTFSFCTSLRTIYSLSEQAPTVGSDAFGYSASSYTGSKTNVDNFLYVPLNAKGYDTGYWLDPLQNASKCGFSIYGQLTINSNRKNAQFGVTYTTVDGPLKSVTVGVGTFYLSDVQYGTSMTIVPITTGVGDWDWTTKTIIYNKDNNVVENNAYVFPQDATIVGESNPVENNTYTWSTTTQNVDGPYTAEWVLSGEITSYLTISSQDNNQCVLDIIQAPTDFQYGTLSLVIKKTNGTILATATKSLSAVIEGVVITSKSNAPVQAVLYNAGLVAHETYSTQDELEKITASQLMNGNYSIFYNNQEITHFEELEYFTGLTTTPDYMFASCKKLTTVKLPNTLTSIGLNAFNLCGDLTEINIPSGVTSIGSQAFYNCRKLANVIFPDSLINIGDRAFYYCYNFTNVVIPDNVKTLGESAFSYCQNIEKVILSASLESIGSTCFWACYKVNILETKATKVPKFGSSPFGAGINFMGKSAPDRLFRIPAGAKGTDWYYGLFLANENDFIICGELTITSNKPSAQFNVAYTSEDNKSKTAVINAGTTILYDMKYESNMTITPVNTDLGEWDWDTLTVPYNRDNKTLVNNAYIYPTAMTISGSDRIIGVASQTYTAEMTPSNFDAPVTYAWSLSNSANASISSSEGGQCTITTNYADEASSFTLTCVVTTPNGQKLQSNRTINYLRQPSFIIAKYNVTSTSSTKLVNSKTYISYMEIDGVVLDSPVTSYAFATKGEHTVRLTASNLNRLWYQCTALIGVDFSECDGYSIKNMSGAFAGSNLATIDWGDCVFPRVTSIEELFSQCDITSIDLSPFQQAAPNITSLYETFYSCGKLTSLDWGGCVFSKVTSIIRMMSGASELSEIDLSPFADAPITDMREAFRYCHEITSIDLSPLTGQKNDQVITWDDLISGERLSSIDFSPFVDKRFYVTNRGTCLPSMAYCPSLKTIIMPFKTAPQASGFGTMETNYTGKNTSDTGENVLYVPAGATGYDTGYWLDPLQNPEKCGFTISYTL